jgi:rRNA-processing protein FCF1
VRVLLFDANVLIDYYDTDSTVFSAIRESVGEIYVLERVLQEVEQLDAGRALELGLQVWEPLLEQMNEAAAGGGRLSFQDHLCLAVARDEGMTCVTNDIALRNRCAEESVKVLWGLELLILSVQKGGLTAAKARNIGTAICELNPRIGSEVFRSFLKKVGK